MIYGLKFVVSGERSIIGVKYSRFSFRSVAYVGLARWVWVSKTEFLYRSLTSFWSIAHQKGMY